MNDPRSIRATTGTNIGGAGAHNRRVVIEALRLNGALSRADLARATRLTAQTVSNIVAELEEDGLVASGEPLRAGRGQPATPYRLVAEGAFAIGLQIDRHIARAVAIDLLGRTLVALDRPLPPGGPEQGVPVVLALVADTRRALAADSPGAEGRLVGLGVAMPGPFGLAVPADDPWMMSAWQAYPLLETLAIGTGLDVALQNDASAAATAERLSGAAHGLDHAVYLYLGYGLGAGLILSGEVYGGAHRNAGEIGMALTLDPDGGLGDRLEHVASIAALCRVLDLDPADPALFARIDAALDAGGAPLAGWLDAAAARLRWTVQLCESLFDPETVILGGTAPARLVAALAERLSPLPASLADRPDRRLPRLTIGSADPWMVARGAAAEPIARAFDPRFAAILKSRFLDR